MSKYPLEYYRHLLSQVVDWLEDKPVLAEGLINFMPKSDREAMRDLLNIY